MPAASKVDSQEQTRKKGGLKVIIMCGLQGSGKVCDPSLDVMFWY